MNPASDFLQLHKIFVYLDKVIDRYGELDCDDFNKKAADALYAINLLQFEMVKLERRGLVDK